ncbi:aldehyde dehydrogenase [Calycina marina]|uniref:aldehyde dehydrogenase (NAD(+)) n=1 Tax=Calycina marina TaxID=1763456 RepID=A0A9P7Z2D2_9HELO|nr:aldehyde dehydrogenase [Calycina marina]
MAPSANGHSGSEKFNFDTFRNVINGKLVDGEKTRAGINPATKKANAQVPVATEKDLDNAVDAAKAAFKTWSRTTIEERKKAVSAYSAALKEQREGFAALLTKEQGKPLPFAQAEADSGVYWLDENVKLELPETVEEETDERKVITRYTPIGVAAAIVPWNFPIQLAIGKIAAALLTGNCLIVKPSPFTPYCGLKLVELAQSFFPPGVLQVLSGDDNLGPWITSHPGIDKISFTGSTATGKRVMESASKTLKRVTLELGGKDPAIVCKSVNIKDAAPKLATLCFMNSGQICIAIKRVYIHESIYNEFRDAMVDHVKTIKVGDGTEEGVFLGPIQNSMQYERVQGFFDDIEKQGQKVAVGGKTADSAGFFINPTIIDNPAADSRIVLEEPFGPILPIMPWSDEEEVIEKANSTLMGLGSSVWSSDLEEATRIARRIDSGSVWVNTHLEVDPKFAFGGHKESGIGSEWGLAGWKAYCNTQVLYLKK